MYTSVSLVLHLSKYLNLETKSKARKCSDPGVLEPLPRKAPPERVASEHGGDEETQGGQDRADRVPEYRLFTCKYQRSHSQSRPEGNWDQVMWHLPRFSRGSSAMAVTLASSTSSDLGEWKSFLLFWRRWKISTQQIKTHIFNLLETICHGDNSTTLPWFYHDYQLVNARHSYEHDVYCKHILLVFVIALC